MQSEKFPSPKWDIPLIVLIALVWGFFILTTQTQSELTFGDFGWYMNRSYWLWHGYYEESFVYTMGYPLILGFLNFFIPNILHAALVWNLFAFVMLAIGLYQLGKTLFNRPVAWIVLALVLSHWQVLTISRQWQTHITFNMILIWCLIAHLYWFRRQTMQYSILSGIMLVLLFFTRIEGIIYNTLWMIGFLWIAHARKNIRIAFFQTLPIVIMSVVASLFYLFILSGDASLETTGSNNFLSLITKNSAYYDIIAWRIYDMLQITTDYWTLWVFILTLFFLIWHREQDRQSLAFILFLFLLHSLAIMLLAPWPSLLKNNVIILYTAFFVAYALWQVGVHTRQPILTGILLILIIAPVVFVARDYNQTPSFAYLDGDISENVREIEMQLSEQDDYGEQFILSLCLPTAPYFEDYTPFIIYRFLGRINDVTRRNSPPNLLPEFDDQSLYLIVCGEIYYQDWQDWLGGELVIPYTVAPHFRTSNIQVFKINHVPSP